MASKPDSVVVETESKMPRIVADQIQRQHIQNGRL